ncbi:MAG: recombinase family protein [Actinomycetia bacterium]|nr:recombinase family protein [Actinomycetes bacterium]
MPNTTSVAEKIQGDGRGAVKAPTDQARALIYLRVSTKEQAEMGGEAEGYSIPAQRAACTRKAEALHAFVEEEFVDRGESAKTADRPELLKMLRYLRDHAVDYVIVHKVDRLARNRADDVAITIAIKESGAVLVSCSENIDETPSGLLLHGIMSSIAEFYSRNLATEVAKGMRQKAKTGGTINKSPVGYRHIRLVENGREVRTVEPDPERAPFVRMAFELYATGEWTLRELHRELTEMGFTSRPGPRTPAKVLTLSAFHKMLMNPYYVGEISYEGVSYQGSHEPLVERELFEQVQAALIAHRHAGEKQQSYNHYLKGSIFCGKCGSKLSVMNPRNRTGVKYHYFFCLGRQYNRQSCTQKVMAIDEVERKIEEHYLTIQILPERIDQITGVLRELLIDRREEAEAAERVETLRMNRLSKEREKLLRLHYEDALPADLFKQEMQRITRELEKARQQLEVVSVSYDAIEKNVERALDLARDCYSAYKDAGPETRRLFNQAFFEKLIVSDTGSVTHELAEPFKLLLDPSLPDRLEQEAKQQAKRRRYQESRNADDPEILRAGGSNYELMVGDTGFEPVTSAV